MITPEHKCHKSRRARAAKRRAALKMAEDKVSFFETPAGRFLERVVSFLSKAAGLAGIAILGLQLRPAHEYSAVYEFCGPSKLVRQSVDDCLMDHLPENARLADALALIEPLGFTEKAKELKTETRVHSYIKAPGWPLEFKAASVMIEWDRTSGRVEDIHVFRQIFFH